jgi:Xaa-Pro dipeptidase
MSTPPKLALGLDPQLSALVEQDYPQFSPAEMRRRRTIIEAAMADAAVDHLVVYGAGFRGGAVQWLSGWATTTEAVLVVSRDVADALFIQYYNHVPMARDVIKTAAVAWGGPSTIQSVIGELARRGAGRNRVGVIGPLPVTPYRALATAYGTVADLNRAYIGARLVKSAEEVAWARIGARLSDLSIEALRDNIRPGLDERELGAIVEAAYHPWGGVNVIHFFGVTSMHEPAVCVPRQHPSGRRIKQGDVISVEISCGWWDYGGQVLRTFTLGEPFTPFYQDLHDTALAAFNAIVHVLKPGCHARDIVAAAGVIENAGFTIYDDLVHGYVGGYLPPVLGSPSRQNEPIPDMTLRAGMMLVVQPNVITKDESAGVQTGECLLITDIGAETIHTAPRGPFHVGI